MITPQYTNLQVSTDNEFINKVLDIAKTYTTQHMSPSNLLPNGVPLYARVRHSTVELGYTPWSAVRQFSIVNFNNRFVTVLGNEASDKNNNFTDIIIHPSSGEIYLSGATDYIPFTSGKMTLVKMDSTGHVLWQKTSTITTNHWTNKIGGIVNNVIYTTGYGTIAYVSCIYLTQWTENGDINWQKVFYSPSAQYADSASCTVVNNEYIYLIMYNVNQGDNLIASTYVYKLLVTDGSVVWGKKIIIPGESCVPTSIVVDNGGYSYTLINNLTTGKQIIIKLDPSGAVFCIKAVDTQAILSKLTIINNCLYVYGDYGGVMCIVKSNLDFQPSWVKMYYTGNTLQNITGLNYFEADGMLYLSGNTNIVNTDLTVENNITSTTDSDIVIAKINPSTGEVHGCRILKNTGGMLVTYAAMISNNLHAACLAGKIANTNDMSKWSNFLIAVPLNFQNCNGPILNKTNLYWENGDLFIGDLNIQFVDIYASCADFDLCSAFNTIGALATDLVEQQTHY